MKHGDKYITIGGNMRLAAIQEAGMEEIPCIIIPDGTPTRTLKEMAIKDNSKFGQWDYDALANDWDEFDLSEFGLPVFDDQPEQETHGDGNASPLDDRHVIEIELTPDEFQFVTGKLRTIADTPEEAVLKVLGL